MKKHQVVEIFCVKYYRGSDGYYAADDSNLARSVGMEPRLHREIWRKAHGPIPEGFVIHHIDGDKCNNELSNLQLIKPDAHSRLHQNEHWSKLTKEFFICKWCGGFGKRFVGVHKRLRKVYCSPKCRWQAKEYRRYVPAKQREVSRVCPCCGTYFQTVFVGAKTRQVYCSRDCKKRMSKRRWSAKRRAPS